MLFLFGDFFHISEDCQKKNLYTKTKKAKKKRYFQEIFCFTKMLKSEWDISSFKKKTVDWAAQRKLVF